MLETVASELRGTDVHLHHGRLAGAPCGTSRRERVAQGRPLRFHDVYGACGACRHCPVAKAATSCLVELVRTVLDRGGDLPSGEVLIASPDGAVSHRELLEAATLHYFGKRADPSSPLARFPRVPIVILTSVTSESQLDFSDRVGTALLPVDAFVEKPVKPAEMLARIEEILERSAGAGHATGD